ncbi:MAG: flagellar hook-basal body protein [Phycisphaerales bacterium JB050]
MNYGLYMAASGMSVSMAKQNVLSNNLANVSTVGYKPDTFATRQRAAVREEDNLYWMDSNAMLERLGAGVMPTFSRVSQAQGALTDSDNPLHIAVQGEGFFRYERADLPEGFSLSRDGRLDLSPEGYLVRSTDGVALLDDSGSRIRIDPGARLDIDADGSLRQDGAVVGRLGLVTVPDPTLLVKAGSGDFTFGEQVSPNSLRAANGRIKQGHLEDSAVDAIKSMMDVTSASRAAQSNMRMASTIFDVMGEAINRLGRTS